jgi:phosphomannomutase
MASANSDQAGQGGQVAHIDPSIFKAYDIRGVVDRSLTEEAVEAIGEALGAKAVAASVKSLVLGRDGRLSGPRLLDALARGVMRHGVDVEYRVWRGGDGFAQSSRL